MAGHEIETQLLGKSDEVIHISTFAELQAAIDRMAAQATRTVSIVSHDTEPDLYGREHFANLLAEFIARRRKVAKIRVLIADPQRAVRETHRLVTLWHRFPSFIDLRELRDQYAATREAFMVVDNVGLVRRPEYDSPAAVVTFRSLTTARDRAAWFEEAWARSAPSVALRRLTL